MAAKKVQTPGRSRNSALLDSTETQQNENCYCPSRATAVLLILCSSLSFPCVRLITLITDFGLSDWFVGTMKGVMLGIHPAARLVDITHQIPPGDVRSGAF